MKMSADSADSKDQVHSDPRVEVMAQLLFSRIVCEERRCRDHKWEEVSPASRNSWRCEAEEWLTELDEA